MARALLDLAPTCRASYCGSMDSWLIIIVILLCLLGIGLTAGILYKLLAPRLALKRGRVPGFMCFPIAKLKDEERHIYLTARCPLGEGEFAPTECPICLTNVTRRHRWVGFPCQHGVCKKCLWPMVKAQEELSACPLCRAPLFLRCASAKQGEEQEGEEQQPGAGAAQEQAQGQGEGQAEGGVAGDLPPTAPSSSSSSASSSSASSEGWSRAGSMALMDIGASEAADLAGGMELAAAAAESGAAQSGRAGTPAASLEGRTTAATAAAAAAGAMQA